MSQVGRRTPDRDDSLGWVIAGQHVPMGDLSGLTLGDFQVERLLGRGGMGEVYLATQVSLNRPVALKVLRPDYLTKGTYYKRFESEATAVAKLNHPNIVHVYTIGGDDQIRFIAMEYVEGTNLRDYIDKKGAVDLPLGLSIMKQAAQAIGAAGEAGLIHRDIKPENILITRRGRVKVADFGLCRDQSGEELHLTQSGVTMGTPAYMSPEQAQGYPVDHRSDLYSLGATYYFMLVGVPPFHAETAVALALKHVREIPRSLLVHRPDLPLEIDRLVMKLMAKDPADRYPSAAVLLAELGRIREALHAGPSAAAMPVFGAATARTEELPASGSHHELALRTPTPPATEVLPARRPAIGAAPAPPAQGRGLAQVPAQAAPRPVGFSGLAAGLALALGLGAGAWAGWAARAPDVQALPVEPSRSLPALWLEPRWDAIPRQDSPEDQLRYAQLRAPREEWAAAWLAVPGHYPQSHESLTAAYTQLARLWYRRDDVDALAVLAGELAGWKAAQSRDRELVAVIRLALKLREGDLHAVADGFKELTLAGGDPMDDPALVALGAEVCSDALQAVVQKSVNPTNALPLRRALGQLLKQLYRIELGEPAGAGRAVPAGKAAARSSGSGGSGS
jgi:serine/threonine-protein kinase